MITYPQVSPCLNVRADRLCLRDVNTGCLVFVLHEQPRTQAGDNRSDHLGSEMLEILQKQRGYYEFDANLGYRDHVHDKQTNSRITLYRAYMCIYLGSCPKLRVSRCLWGIQLKESFSFSGSHLSRSLTQPHLVISS